MEVIAIAASLGALVISIVAIFCTPNTEEIDNKSLYRFEDIDRSLASLRRDLNFEVIESKKVRDELYALKTVENVEPYDIIIHFKGHNDFRRFNDIVSHEIKSGESDFVSSFDQFSFSVGTHVIRTKDEELIAYRKGDKKDDPSVKIKIEEYESIEIIKKEDD